MSGTADHGVLVLAASVAFDGQRLSEQHLALALADAGHEILYLDPPRAFWSREAGFTDGRVGRPVSWTVTTVAPRLTRATLAVPPGVRRHALLPWVDRLRGVAARRLLASRHQRAGAVLSAAGRPSVFAGYGNARRVFWAKDDYVAGAGLLGMDAARIAAGQLAVARVIDAAVAVTPGLLKTWQARVSEVALIPAGSDPAMAEAAARAEPHPDVALASPVAGFVGQISDRIDLGLLEAVAETGASLLLVGRRQPTFGGGSRFEALVGRANVQWLGSRDYEALPAYLAAMDVGLIPYTDSAFNRASFPLKLLEYLSVGAGVVATDLPAVRWLASPEVRVASGSAFADAVVAELAVSQTGGAPLEARRRARRAEASRHTWADRAGEFSTVLWPAG